jgi:nanoRNase/pAp phosphatase (c-di-AMP/oligoRNAs hydrolase)
MSDQIYNEKRIKELLDSSDTIAVAPSEIGGADSFSAAAGLYLALRNLGKNVSFIYIGNVPDECIGLLSEDQIVSDIYSRKLEIAIDYSGTPASKLAYSNEDNILKLVLSPVARDFDHSKIKTEIKGHDFDLVFTLGVQHPEDLGGVSKELKDEFFKAKIVNLDNTAMNTKHGDINVIDAFASNLSELVFKLFSNLGIVPDGKAARALLVGMSYREPQS